MVLTTSHGSAHSGRPTLLAHYDNFVHARDAIRALEASGVDGDDLALVGEAVLTAERQIDREAVDSRILENTTRAVALGVVGGALAGALIGAVLVGITVLVWSGLTNRGWVLVLMVAWFAAGGAVLGAMAAIARTVGFSESLELTWRGDPGEPVWLAVYGDAPDVRPTVDGTSPFEVIEEPGVTTTHPAEAPRVAS